jgi:putative Mg2+ transporter-C (MgtC) family protein
MAGLFQDTTFSISDMAIRLAIATVLGVLLGLDRELRGIAAGMRTHALVSLSSAAITLSALDLYGAVRAHGGDADPLRVIQGLAQAIGFIAAGAIFVFKGDVRNLTTAANVWLTTAVGIAAGAGQTMLAILAAGFGVAVVTLLRLAEHHLPSGKEPPDE